MFTTKLSTPTSVGFFSSKGRKKEARFGEEKGSMSGARLCVLLGELGFDGHESLDPDSFEWPFQYEDARPLLDWICSTLRPSNILSLDELSQYDEFVRQGKLLEGEDLDAAYESISAFSSRRDDNQEAIFGAEERLIVIREAKLAYKAETLELQKHLGNLQSHLDLLVDHQASSLVQGRRGRLAATSTINEKLLSLDEKLSGRNLEMNAVLGRIASTAQELAQYHSGDGDGIYLTYSDFSSYLFDDSSCTEELNKWFVKQFETGPLHLVAEEGKSKCSWASLDDITNCSGQGDSEKSHHHLRLAELQRLRSIFGTSERQWVESQVENARQQAILSTLRSQISCDEARIRRDIHSLRRNHSELSGELSNMYMKEKKLLYEVIPALCSELAQLQDTYILQGDYDLKVMRQEYYISCQKTFIDHLVNQLARNYFLKIACQIEQKIIHGAHSLLAVIDTELHDYLSAACLRVGHYLAVSRAASDVHEQGVVDDRDTFLHSIRDLLCAHSNGQGILPMYLSVPGIIQEITSLHSDLNSLHFELDNALPEDRRRYINELCTLIQSMEQLLFANSTASEPILTPKPLVRALEDMEKVNSQLSVSVEEVTEAHRQKAEIVKHHPHEVGRERQVFVDFFCNPDRLRGQVRELTARVKSLHE